MYVIQSLDTSIIETVCAVSQLPGAEREVGSSKQPEITRRMGIWDFGGHEGHYISTSMLHVMTLSTQ